MFMVVSSDKIIYSFNKFRELPRIISIYETQRIRVSNFCVVSENPIKI